MHHETMKNQYVAQFEISRVPRQIDIISINTQSARSIRFVYRKQAKFVRTRKYCQTAQLLRAIG